MSHAASPVISAVVSSQRQTALNLRSAVRRHLRALKAVAEAPVSDLAREEFRRASAFLGGATLAFDVYWKVKPQEGER